MIVGWRVILYNITLFFSEDENEVWYYSTKHHLTELLHVLDGAYWERDLVRVLTDLKEDIMRQMNITVELTKEKGPGRKSVIENEIGMYLSIKVDTH